MHIGRTVAGLPSGSYEFAILPPHFEQQDEWIQRGVKMVFQGIPESLAFVGEYCLASLVYHTSFIRTHLPARHPLFETALFQDAELLDCLRSRVECGFSGPNTHLTATGLPPHVSILGQMKALQDNTLSTIEKIEDARQGIVKDIAHELEQRAIGARTFTFDGLHDALRSCLAEAGVHDLVSRQNMSEQQIDEHHEVQEEDTVLPTFFWAGRFRRIPPDFVLPDCSPAHLWVLWRCGNAEKRLPPLRLLDDADMPNRNSQQRQ